MSELEQVVTEVERVLEARLAALVDLWRDSV
jgi:hypothetical protein